MTRKDLNNVKIGDIVKLNKRCKQNSGVCCTVLNIDKFNGIIEVQTIDNAPIYVSGVKTIWNEVSYQAVTLA